MIRNKRILHSIDITKGEGLEIGPLSSPILSKDQAKVFYLDHESTEGLRKKYKNEPVELSKIVDVDYVLKDGKLAKTVGENKFDYALASHVIEHIPDTVRWLQDIEKILKPGGFLSLVIPDKRFTFDFNRRISLPADIMGAYYDQLTRFSSAMMYDFARECMLEVDTAQAWHNPEQYLTAPRRWSLEQVNDKCKRNLDPKQYVDCHCFVFTPQSFIEILRELIEQGLFNYEVAYFLETQEYELEFYVTLKKLDPKKINKRKQLATLPTIQPKKTKEEQLTEEAVILKQELMALKGSLSWRATKALRKIRNLLAKEG
jgi:SAM-dependent methyltransferase